MAGAGSVAFQCTGGSGLDRARQEHGTREEEAADPPRSLTVRVALLLRYILICSGTGEPDLCVARTEYKLATNGTV